MEIIINENQYTRLFKKDDKVKLSEEDFNLYRKQNKEEMWEFHILRKSNTGLPVNIFVDENKSYEMRNHDLWIYFQNDYNDNGNHNNVLPISIDINPQLMVNSSLLKIFQSDLEKIKKFVKLNRVILKKHANGTIDDEDFWWKMDVNRLNLEESFNKVLLMAVVS